MAFKYLFVAAMVQSGEDTNFGSHVGSEKERMLNRISAGSASNRKDMVLA